MLKQNYLQYKALWIFSTKPLLFHKNLNKLIITNQDQNWTSAPTMNEKRTWAASTMFEGNDDLWWITGGAYYLTSNTDSTELYFASNNSFAFSVPMPVRNDLHVVVNINSTHTVMLGGRDTSDLIFIFDR